MLPPSFRTPSKRWPTIRRFPPLETRERPKGFWKDGRRTSKIRHAWGEIKVDVQRLLTRAGRHATMLLDPALDHSGWSPWALERLVDLAARLPYEEAALVARSFGLTISPSALERLVSPYTKSCRDTVRELLGHAEREPRQANEAPGRLMVLQLDGVHVLKKPEAGRCEGMEVKSVVLYPEASPGERRMLAEVTEARELLPLVDGLLRQADLSPHDTLVGLGDGASWVEGIFDSLGATRITDVYHSAGYLDTLMQELGWDDSKRAEHRKRWCEGKVSARDWLREHLPGPEIWMRWEEEAHDALNYLEKRLESMDYPKFKAKGWPIGSGQVEGMNKSVIGKRMKQSGMQWTHEGAAGMASLRAQTCAKHPLVAFDILRQQAYPPPVA